MTSLPAKFCERIRRDYASEAEQLLSSLDTAAGTSIRVNPFKQINIPNGVSIPWTTQGYYLQERPSFTADPLFHAGCYYVQEASSMFIEHLFRTCIDENKSMAALDLCAAPGGKSTLLMSLLNKDSYVVSNEFISSRASILQENIIKWGLGNAFVTNNDPAHFSRLKHHFDLVLIDAPCSGEGLFRKDPDARLEWSEANCALCEKRQEKIIMESWDCIKPGGLLFYSTCTFNPGENEQLLASLKEQISFESIQIPINSDWNIREIHYQGIYGYQFLPHQTKGEGFFISVLKKPGSEVEKVRKTPVAAKPVSDKLLQKISGEQYASVLFRENYHFASARMLMDFNLIDKHLNLKYFGTEVGQIIKGKLIPSHPLALSPFACLDEYEKIALSKKEAQLYLSRKEFEVASANIGWKIFTYEGQALGFAKHLGNRWNNYYPLQWRIRMEIKQEDSME